MKHLAILFAFVSLASPALAAANGMYLCRSPVVAGDFWSDVMSAHRLNLPITADTLKRIAEKNECLLSLSPDMKPVDFVAGELLMKNGSTTGWVEPHYYILYVNGTNSQRPQQ